MKATVPSVLLTSLALLASCGGTTPEGASTERPGAAAPAGEAAEAPESNAGLHGVVAPEGTTAEDPEALLSASVGALAARPEHTLPEVQVQHILVGVTHPRLAGVQRTVEEARAKAAGLMARIAQGEDFGALVKEATDDSPPGIYGMAMNGPGDTANNVFPRRQMAAAFGNVGWKLEVGEVSVATYDLKDSPFGFHIILRTK